MTQQIELTNKPPIYQGHPIPLKQLSPGSFEDFVYQCLSLLGKSKGFKMQSGPQPSADQGFDCTAKTIDNGEVVCIQCKRYTTTTLDINTVAEELIKIGLDCALNKSIVKQHYIITTGTVTANLRQALRQTNYLNLKNECEKIIIKRKFQPALLDRAEENNIVPLDTVLKYIESLDNLMVWSDQDFTNELLIIWNELGNVLEKHFSLEKILKDTPTPNFDINDYLRKISTESNGLTNLHYTQSHLPNNVESVKNLEKYTSSLFSIEDLGTILKNNKNIILSSPGGSGKSSSLSILQSNLIASQFDIEYLPIKIRLRSYSRNSLNEMINYELGITHGSWRSLPFKFIFLFDGLDEMLQHDTQAFHDNLVSIIGNSSYILTTRNTGLSVETVFNSIDSCFSIQPLSYRSVLKMVEKILKNDKQLSFYNEYREKVGTLGYNFLSSPFAVSLSINYYEKYSTLPNSIEDVLEDWVSTKIEGDKKRIKNTSLKLNRLAKSKIEEAISLITYKAKFEKKSNSIPEDIFIDLLVDTYKELKEQGSYISMFLDLHEFIEMVNQYEIYIKGLDKHFATPHTIISDYLASKVLSKTWHCYKESDFDQSLHDVWLYCSNFIAESDKEEYLETVFKFDIILGARVAKNFQGKYISIIQDKVLELEKSTKVLTRSEAVFALGLLGTDKCYERLRSKDGYLDHYHQYQRRRALALNGDQDTLIDIISKNENAAQLPMKISGGEYDLWFKCPPTSITNIARERLEWWLNNNKIPLCMSLMTLELFGDNFDINNITSVLESTNQEKEFHHASKALYIIDNDMLVKALRKIIDDRKQSSYWAKKNLLSMGLNCNIDEEFEFFIAQSKKDESELSHHACMHSLCNLVDFLKMTKIDDNKISTLIATYKQLKFRNDFYYNKLIWSLASSGESGRFLPIVELAYSRKDPEQINNAISYLSNLEILDIDCELSKKIDEYFYSLSGKYEGIFKSYVEYYYKHKSKSFSIDLIKKKIKEKLSNLSPSTITREKYIGDLFSYNFIFDFLSKDVDSEIIIPDEDALKFLLIDTDHLNDMEKNVKFKVLSSIEKTKLDCYSKEIIDPNVKLYVINYLLYNDLTSKCTSLFQNHLLLLLSHHMFHPTIEKVCRRYWTDELARFFLTCFVELEWSHVNAQMFEKYTKLFLELISKEQLAAFEKERTKPIHTFVERIYQIWLESNKLIYHKHKLKI